MTDTILVTNLPPRCSPSELRGFFSFCGSIAYTVINSEYYHDTYFPLNSAYITFSSREPFDYLTENPLDLVLRGFYLTIERAVSSPRATRGFHILGIPPSINEEQLDVFLHLPSDADLTLNRPMGPDSDGIALIVFPDGPIASVFLSRHHTLSIDDTIMAVRAYPAAPALNHPPVVVDASSRGRSFAAIRHNPRFQDFAIRCSGNERRMSSKVIAAASKVARANLRARPPIMFCEVIGAGDIDEVIDSLYGMPIAITQQNCRFIHAVASQLQIPELIASAGCACYELLTDLNACYVSRQLVEAQSDLGYIAEFFAREIGMHKTPLRPELPPQVVLAVARHPYIAELDDGDIRGIFGTYMDAGILRKENIAVIDNPSFDISANRRLLLDSIPVGDSHTVH
jgi:hypothetical protein